MSHTPGYKATAYYITRIEMEAPMICKDQIEGLVARNDFHVVRRGPKITADGTPEMGIYQVVVERVNDKEDLSDMENLPGPG